MQDWVFRLGLESLKFFLVKSVRFVNHCAAFETRKPNQSCLQLFFSIIFRLHGGLEPLVDLIKDSEEKTENKKLLAAVTGHYEVKILMKLQ